MKNEKLPKKFKDKWVKALLSGEFKQGTGMLYNSGKYCCLGVACCIVDAPIFEEDGVIELDQSRYDAVPDTIKGDARQNNIVCGLTTINDNLVPFEVIAGVIDQWL